MIQRAISTTARGQSEPLGPEPSDAQQIRFRLFDAVASYLRRAAETQPLLITLDDLHWADKSSLLLLRFVARELRDARVLITGCYRDIELRRGHPLAEALGELMRETHFRRIPLRGLELESVAEYLRSVAGCEFDSELVASLHDRTEGNPFFMGEMVRLMLQESQGRPPGPDAFSHARLPEGVREAIGRRPSALPPDCNRMPGSAAFLGPAFPPAPAARGGYGNDVPHAVDFIECMATRKRPAADLETIGHPSSLLCHLGNIAWRAGRSLRFDPDKYTFIGDEDANRFLTRPVYRKPWVLPEIKNL